MACTTKPAKQLGELLQEQQEPFVLETYLVERGLLRKSLSSSTNSNTSKSFKSSYSWGPNKSKKGTLSFSKVLRSVYNKFFSKNGLSRNECSEKEEGKFDDADTSLPRDCKDIGESDRVSSASSRTQYESCVDSDKDEAAAPVMLQNEDHTLLAVQETSLVSRPCNVKERIKIERLNGESSKKLKPRKQHISVSVLEVRPSSHAGLPLPKLPDKVVEDSMLSASLWELLFQPTLEKSRSTSGIPEMLEPVIRSNPCPHKSKSKSKRMLQQTRQLLFDCVREMTETHTKKIKDEQRCTKFLEAEQLGKLIYEKLRIWDTQAGDESSIDFLLDSDLLTSAEEWRRHELDKKEICCQVGDAILEEIIQEIVVGK